jgi:hypothetical protein
MMEALFSFLSIKRSKSWWLIALSSSMIMIALLSQASAESTANMIITISVKPTVLVVDQDRIGIWILKPIFPVNLTKSGLLIVKANTDWVLRAEDDNPETAGFMTEWDGKSYGAKKLSQPLKISSAREVTLPAGGIIMTGSRTSGGQNVDVNFMQQVPDINLPKTENYRIEVTFIGSPLI